MSFSHHTTHAAVFAFSVSAEGMTQLHHAKYRFLSFFCTQHLASDKCPCFSVCLPSILLIALSLGLTSISFRLSCCNDSLISCHYEQCRGEHLPPGPVWEPLRDTNHNLPSSTEHVPSTKQEASTFSDYFYEKVRPPQSFSGGRMVSRWNTDWIYRKPEPLIYHTVTS